MSNGSRNGINLVIFNCLITPLIHLFFNIIIEDFNYKLRASLQRGDWLQWVHMYRTLEGKWSDITDTTVISLRGNRRNQTNVDGYFPVWSQMVIQKTEKDLGEADSEYL